MLLLLFHSAKSLIMTLFDVLFRQPDSQRPRRPLPTELLYECICAAHFPSIMDLCEMSSALEKLAIPRARRVHKKVICAVQETQERIKKQFTDEISASAPQLLQIPANHGKLLFVGLVSAEVFTAAHEQSETAPSTSSAANQSQHRSSFSKVIAVWQNWIALLSVSPSASDNPCNEYRYVTNYIPSELHVHFGKRHMLLQSNTDSRQLAAEHRKVFARIDLAWIPDFDLLAEAICQCTGIAHDYAEASTTAAAAEQQPAVVTEAANEEEQQPRRRRREPSVVVAMEGGELEPLQPQANPPEVDEEQQQSRQEDAQAAVGDAANDGPRRSSLPAWFFGLSSDSGRQERPRAQSDTSAVVSHAKRMLLSLRAIIWKPNIQVTVTRHRSGRVHKTMVANLNFHTVVPKKLGSRLKKLAAEDKRSIAFDVREHVVDGIEQELLEIEGDERIMVYHLLVANCEVPHKCIWVEEDGNGDKKGR